VFSVEHTAALAWIDLIVLSDRARVGIGRVAISLRLVLVVLLHKRFAVTVIFERGIALQQVRPACLMPNLPMMLCISGIEALSSWAMR
jgi:hypothetical protein